MKSPLKSKIDFKSIGELKKIIPPESTISSFFLYSGDVELALASGNRTVIAHTNKLAVYEFWAALSHDPKVVYDAAKHVFPTITDPEFYLLQESWVKQKSDTARAALFFILNRCSELGVASCGKIDKSNFNSLALSHLKRFKADNFYPYLDKFEDPTDAFQSAKRTNYILLPVGGYSFNLFEYGKNRGPDTALIDHRAIYKKVKKIDKRWLILYKKHNILFDMYKDYNIMMVDKYGRRTNSKDFCEELIIANF